MQPFLSLPILWNGSSMVKVLSTDSVVLKGSLRYMYKSGDEFLNGEEPFTFFLQKEKPATTVAAADSGDGLSNIKTQSLWWIFLAAFAGGSWHC